jgi:hypothetical protein
MKIADASRDLCFEATLNCAVYASYFVACRAFLIEEQKIVKRVLQDQQKKEKAK